MTTLQVGDWVLVEIHDRNDQSYEGHVLVHETRGTVDELVVECPNGPTIRIATLVRDRIRHLGRV